MSIVAGAQQPEAENRCSKSTTSPSSSTREMA